MRGVDVYHGDSINGKSKLKPIPEKAYLESDFVIIKATQGTSYKYTDFFYSMIERAIIDDKLIGAYHYAGGHDPIKEADYFLSVVKHYINRIILCLDWEGDQNKAYGNKTWCKRFIDRVQEKTGVTCFLYVNDEGIHHCDNLLNKVPLWFAGFPKPQATNWTVPKFKYNLGKWNGYAIWQFTSNNEKIDRNTSPLSREQWMAYAVGNKVQKKVTNKTTVPAKKVEGTETNPAPVVSYYPKYTGKSNSIVDALSAVGVKDTSKAYRAKIAKANGIAGYKGTASQNEKMLKLLKVGKLKKV